jgi:hypothetical protein
MNEKEIHCFVIMPYDKEFDDVYTHIKNAVENADGNQVIRCTRSDDKTPAGKIHDRLLNELKSADLFIADVTGDNPNVMWEIGYATALGKQVLILTQVPEVLPFDIKNYVYIHYDRNHLKTSLVEKLSQSVHDTLADLEARSHVEDEPQTGEGDAIQAELKEMKGMIGELLRGMKPPVSEADANGKTGAAQSPAKVFEGAWFNPETGSYLYAREVQGEVLMPYCYGGDTRLTGVYRDLSRVGEYWLARYSWVDEEISGFAFIKEVNADLFSGAWWMDEDVAEMPNSPPETQGVLMTLERLEGAVTPAWAEEFFAQADQLE